MKRRKPVSESAVAYLRRGAGPHGDRRTKRKRTRSARKQQAIRDSRE